MSDHGGEVACVDCGRLFRNRPDETGALCDECCDERDAHTDAAEIRMAQARRKVPAAAGYPWAIDVVLIPVSEHNAVVEVALVPVPKDHPDGRALRKMARAILAADLTTIKDVA